MNSIAFKYSNILITIVTIAFIFCGMFGVFDSSIVELTVAAILITIVGLPHGATDLLLVKYLSTDKYKHSVKRTLIQYLGLIGLYGLVWFLFPQLAFLLFIVISIYHFGQSNYHSIQINSKAIRTISYLISGSFVLLTPLCIHHEIAIPIIETISGTTAFSVDAITAQVLTKDLFLVNLWVLVFLLINEWISAEEFVYQLISTSLLMFCFHYLPLILGFTVYFVFWHSYGSMVEQIEYIRTKNESFTWSKYYGNALPITFLAIVLIGTCYWINITWSINFSIIELFFIMLSLLTLPHILLIEQLYSSFRQTNSIQIQQFIKD